MKLMISCLVVVAFFCHVNGHVAKNAEMRPSSRFSDGDSSLVERTGKFLRYLPSIDLGFMQFRVDPRTCAAKSNVNGTCMSMLDCKKQLGKEDGFCGVANLGVCCVFEEKCGSTVKQNNTYLVNPGYPNKYRGIGNCQYVIESLDADVCQLRLDFESMTLFGPSVNSRCETDTFTVVGSSGENPMAICGENSGQHMYLEMSGKLGSARINVATTSDQIDRGWRIKVTQIRCDSPIRAPTSCLQYYTEISGMVRSFNYQDVDAITQLANQRYTVCIKTGQGFCGISYRANNFSLIGDGSQFPGTIQSGDTQCTLDYVTIPALDKSNLQQGQTAPKDRFCGNKFDPITTYSKPFEIRVVTNDEEQADIKNKGFLFRYAQVPC